MKSGTIEPELDVINPTAPLSPTTGKPIKLIETGGPRIRGVVGLAHFLKCSTYTAQRLKDSGKIPYFQVGRIILFNEKQVLEAIDHPQTANQ